MNKITPLMTSLHEGHKAEERIQCIDDMLIACQDTKYTVLQALLWYRKYTKVKLHKLKQIEQIVNTWNNDASHSFSDMCKINEIIKKEEWEEDLKM